MKHIVILIFVIASSPAHADEDFEKLINFWAGTVCALADPATWEDDTDEGPDEHAQNYGYASEAAVAEAFKKHIGEPSVKAALRKKIDSKCPGRIDAEQFEGMVGVMQEQYGGN